MLNDEIEFRDAWRVAGYAYNTIKRWRYQGVMPFPVYERRSPQGSRPKLFCRLSEIEAWKQRATTMVPQAFHKGLEVSRGI